MQDIQLWRHLKHPSPDIPLLVQQLTTLVEQPIYIRQRFFGRLMPWADHTNEEIRSLIVRCLAGCCGLPGLRAVVRSLNDTSEAVQQACVDVLWDLLNHDASLFLHALYHPNGAVRAKAIQKEKAPSKLDLARFLLIADPVCKPELIEAFSDKPLPVDYIRWIISLVDRAALTEDEARLLVLNIEWSQVELSKLLSRAYPKETTAKENTRTLQRILELFWNESSTDPGVEDSLSGDQFFEKLSDALSRLSQPFTLSNTKNAFLNAAKNKGSWTQAAFKTYSLLDPSVVFQQQFPVAFRKKAVQSWMNYPTPNIQETLAGKELKTLDILFRDGGFLDMEIFATLLTMMAPDHSHEKAFELIDEAIILVSITTDPFGAIPFLKLDPSPKKKSITKRMIQLLLDWEGINQIDLTCAIIAARPVNELLFLTHLPLEKLTGVCHHLFQYESTKQHLFGESKLTNAAMKIAQARQFAYADNIVRFIRYWIDSPLKQESWLGREFLERIARKLSVGAFINAILQLEDNELDPFLCFLDACTGLPHEAFAKLVKKLQKHTHIKISNWAKAKEQELASIAAVTVESSGEPLNEYIAQRISDTAPSRLDHTLDCFSDHRMNGLCKLLSKRTFPTHTSVVVCSSLLVCPDRPGEIDAQFSTFSDDTPSFYNEVYDYFFTKGARVHGVNVSIFGNSLMVNWDKHCETVEYQIFEYFYDYLHFLSWTFDLSSSFLREVLWNNFVRLMKIFRWRKRDKLAEMFDHSLARFLVEKLTSDMGVQAAKILAVVYNSGAFKGLFERLKPEVEEVLGQISQEIHILLRDWVSSQGLSGSVVNLHKPIPGVKEDTTLPIPTQLDLDRLESECRGNEPFRAGNAARSLLKLGDIGLERLFAIIASPTLIPCIPILCETVTDWPEGKWLERVEDLINDQVTPAVTRFYLGVALYKRGNLSIAPAVYKALKEDTKTNWFDHSDWKKLLRAGFKEKALCEQAIHSPQVAAYRPAVDYYLENAKKEDAERQLLTFLEFGTDRYYVTRREVAHYLLQKGYSDCFPVILDHVSLDRNTWLTSLKDLLARDAALRDELFELLLIAGVEQKSHKLLFWILEVIVNSNHKVELLRRIILESRSPHARQVALNRLLKMRSSVQLIKQMAELCIWGSETAFSLAHERFKFEMIESGEAGYTRLGENILYVSPLPLITTAPHSKSIMKGIILHELGHHLYHKGDEAIKIWEEAADDGLGQLLNLVSDEHLERNIRALNADFGTSLKHLAAYYFQHHHKEYPGFDILLHLGIDAFPVMTKVKKQVGLLEGNLVINNKEIWRALEQQQNSFARFCRALRMGLGNRHQDPKVAQGLALFDKGFKSADMEDLYEISKKLREIFGESTSLLQSMDQETQLANDEEDPLIKATGISSEQLEAEISRQLAEKKLGKESRNEEEVCEREINKDHTRQFDIITQIRHLPHLKENHMALARQVRYEALQMRKYFLNLGLRGVPQYGRIAGFRLDRNRLRQAVLFNDPRVMVSRKTVPTTDLFLGILIDCSGSMAYDNNIDKAKLFGTLLAEAARGMKEIDVRIFGFTDRLIYDAGNDERCAVHSLEARGGNNDAAALWHVSRLALASRRKARLLVMISDGSPTECSVDALRDLVKELTAQRLACAQIAVRALAKDEICFPQYIEMDEHSIKSSVREFGRIIMRLVRQAMAA